eukprot:5674878-Prymnesium_polylepis.1
MNGKSMWCDEIVDAALAQVRAAKATKAVAAQRKGVAVTKKQSAAKELVWGVFSLEHLSTNDLATVMGHVFATLK